VEALLASPVVNPNATDANGNSALHYAAYFRAIDVAKRLAARPEIDRAARNAQGKTPADLAADVGEFDLQAVIQDTAQFGF
jgi:ankyrin repeat protein